jgi:hypothetical protein
MIDTNTKPDRHIAFHVAPDDLPACLKSVNCHGDNIFVARSEQVLYQPHRHEFLVVLAIWGSYTWVENHNIRPWAEKGYKAP